MTAATGINNPVLAPDRPIEGQEGARTPQPPGSAAPGDAAAGPIDVTAIEIARDHRAGLPRADAEGQQLDLLGGAAERENQRRRAGRPEGSANRRNAETFDHLEALGFKAPERLLIEVISADTVDLAKRLKAEPLEVLKLQVRAASDLMPYKLARKPLEHKIERTDRHLFLAGQLTVEQTQQIEEIQWLSHVPDVRQNAECVTRQEETEADQGDSG